MIADKSHERERVIGVGDRASEIPERHPANATMIKLDELAIGFLTLLFTEDKTFLLGRLRGDILKVGGEIVRPSSVGPAFHFHLHDSQVHAHLQDLPAIAGLHLPGLHFSRLEFPVAQSGIDILAHFVFSAPGFLSGWPLAFTAPAATSTMCSGSRYLRATACTSSGVTAATAFR